MWLALGVVLALPAGADEPNGLKTHSDRVSYSLGVDLARQFRRQQVEVDPAFLLKGFQDALADQGLLLSDKEIRRALNGFTAVLQRKLEEQRSGAAAENKRRSAAFLAANRNRPGVTALPSGVQYRVLKAGHGRKPTERNRIVCHYRGTLLDGTEFDATGRDKPAVIDVARLIPGWQEAVRLMPAGSRWQIAVPPHLAYGEGGVDDEIGPNETLLLDVELIAVR